MIKWFRLQKADDPVQPTVKDFYHRSKLPKELADHPLFTGKTTVGMITADWPKFKGLPGDPNHPITPGGNPALEKMLRQHGLKFEGPCPGSYGKQLEESYIVHGPTREQMYRLGHQFGQEGVVFSQHGRHELMYTRGPLTGQHHEGLPVFGFHPTEPPKDLWTHLPGRGYLSLKFQSRLKLSPIRHVVPPFNDPMSPFGEQVRQGVYGLKKALEMTQGKGTPHPHSYAWHDGHTGHHGRTIGHGEILTDEEYQNLFRLIKKEELSPTPPRTDLLPAAPYEHVNHQSASKGAEAYHKYAAPYGQVNPATPSHLKFYPMHGKAKEVDGLVKQHGYTVYYAGGGHGRANLNERNYNTNHLMLWDPSADSGSSFGDQEYTDSWRKVHELAHALTHKDLNATYGEGRRIGPLGKQRTTREALRAVHWEHLAATKQRELSAQIGIHVSNEDFNREYNTIMHDAVHRAVTGRFTSPDEEGFVPHSHQIPLETSLGLVREAAHSMGLGDEHALVDRAIAKSILDDIRDTFGSKKP